MKKIKYYLCCLCCIMLVMLYGTPAMEASAAEENTGSLDVILRDTDTQTYYENVQIGLCRVARMVGSHYFPVEDFMGSGISISALINNNNAEHAKAILRYINDNNLSYQQAVTDVNGAVAFNNLERGIYLVFCVGNQEYTFNPHIVFVPYDVVGGKLYNLISTPKVEVNTERTRDITITKLWDDNNDERHWRPDKITVDINRNGQFCKSVELTAADSWQLTVEDLKYDGVYTIKEKAVSHYKDRYEGNEVDGFVITNTYYYVIPPDDDDETESIPETVDKIIDKVVPNTGDPTNNSALLAIMMASAMMIVILIRKKKKN